jgi:hypothetical protein
MVEQKDSSLVTCMAFVEIEDYAKKSVTEQIKLRERFNAALSTALQGVAPGDRIVLDTTSGAAVAFLGKTEDALLVAMRLRDSIAAESPQSGPALAARIGINIGPIKLVKDAGGEPNIIGDGITVAQSVTGFAAPGQVLVSHAYSEAVSRVSPQYGQLLEVVGSRTDKYLREHQVYAAVAGAGKSPPSGTAGAGRSRKMRMGALAAIAAILVIAVGVRSFRGKPPPPVEPAPVAVAEPAPAPVPAAVPEPAPAAPPPVETPAPKKKVVKPKAEVVAPVATAPTVPLTSPPVAPGSLEFAIAPWGEVYVDGAKRGVSPPLTEVKVPPGKHTIEVRNTSFPSYSTTIEVTSGAQSKIKYKFN